jgi:hypothetical protein
MSASYPLPTISSYLQGRDWYDVDIQRAASQALFKLVSVRQDGLVSLPTVLGALAVHCQDLRLQYQGFSVLTGLVNKSSNNVRAVLVAVGTASLAVTAMEVGRGNESMQKDGCRLFQVLARAMRARREELKTRVENTAAADCAAAVLPPDQLKSMQSSPKSMKDEADEKTGPRTRFSFLSTIQNAIFEVFEASENPPDFLERVEEASVEELRKDTSNEAAQLIFSTIKAYAIFLDEGELTPWRECFLAVLQALEAFPQSKSVQTEGLAALDELLRGPCFAALCSTPQLLTCSCIIEEADPFVLDRLRLALVRVVAAFPTNLQLLNASLRLLWRFFEGERTRITLPFCSGNNVEPSVVGPFTRSPSHYWDLQEAGLDFKEKSTQLADLPKTC